MKMHDELSERSRVWHNHYGLPLVFYAIGREEIERFVAEGGDVHETVRIPPPASGYGGWNAITNLSWVYRFVRARVVIRERLVETLEALIELGVDVNHRDGGGRSPILRPFPAAAVKVLIDAGANVNDTDDYGFTALFDVDEPEAVSVLVDAGLDVNRPDKTGMTPLHWEGCERVARALIECGADIERKDNNGETPLHKQGNPDVLRLLIEAGADLNSRCADGSTPIHALGRNFAFSTPSDIGIVKCRLLLDAGADINARDFAGNTALHKTVNDEVAAFLLRRGADPAAVNDNGEHIWQTTDECVGLLVKQRIHAQHAFPQAKPAPRRLK